MLEHITFPEYNLTPENRAEILNFGELYGAFQTKEAAREAMMNTDRSGPYVIADDNATGQYLLFLWLGVPYSLRNKAA